MKVKEYLERLPKGKFDNGQSVAEVMAETVSIWSNNACEGYVRIATKRLGLSYELTQDLIHALHVAFDECTVEDADEFA